MGPSQMVVSPHLFLWQPLSPQCCSFARNKHRPVRVRADRISGNELLAPITPHKRRSVYEFPSLGDKSASRQMTVRIDTASGKSKRCRFSERAPSFSSSGNLQPPEPRELCCFGHERPRLHRHAGPTRPTLRSCRLLIWVGSQGRRLPRGKFNSR